MITYLLALGFGIVGSIPALPFGKQENASSWSTWRILLLAYTLAMWPYLYFALPSFAGPFWGMASPLIIMWLVAAIVGEFRAATERAGINRLGFAFSAVLLLTVSCRSFAGSKYLTKSDRHGMVGEVVQLKDTGDLAPIDLKHIRLVSLEQAAWLANKALGDKQGEALGSRYHVGHPTLQLVKGDFIYVAALEYLGPKKWLSNKGIPGYVVVSATDPTAQPKLVTTKGDQDLNFRYMPSGYFGDYLDRYIFQSGYRSYNISDYHFELDEEENPWWVVTLTQPSHGYAVDQIQLVLLVDPTSGKIVQHTLSDLPSWVDRAIPQALAVSYLSWWGEYVGTWWNALFWGNGAIKPTDSENGETHSVEKASLVYGSDGQAYWFTGMTSTSTTDQALVCCVMMNSRTGQVKQFPMTGANETAVMHAASSAVSNFKGQHPTNPIPYHLYGETVWVVPILSETHIFQKLVLVRAKDVQVVIGDNKQLALDKLKQLLAGTGGHIDPTSTSQLKNAILHVSRCYGDVQNGTTVYYLWSQDLPAKVFTGTSQINFNLPLITQGDEIEIGYLDTTEEVVPISTFVLKKRMALTGSK